MAFIREIGDAEATGRARELFDEDRAKDGYVWNLTRVLARRPEVVDAWRGLIGTIRARMEARRYELVTMAAARALRASYCMLAHGAILRAGLLSDEQLAALAREPREAGLAPAELAVVEYAAHVARDAATVTRAEVEALRTNGLSDDEIFDVTLAAAARAFFTKTLDALGVEPDAAYRQLAAPLREVLTPGRPIAEGVPS